MNSLLCFSLLACSVGYGDSYCGDAFELVVPECGHGDAHVEPYVPQAGDIVLFSHRNPLLHGVYYLSLSGGIATHVGIIVARPDGSPGLLEAYFCQRVVIRDLGERMREYPGKMYVRRRLTAPTPEESARLTAFACDQVGKPYNLPGMLKPTFFQPVRYSFERCWAPEDINRSGWICSALVVACCEAGGLMDPSVVRPTGTSASDLYTDGTLDLSCGWERPALLRFACPSAVGAKGRR